MIMSLESNNLPISLPQGFTPEQAAAMFRAAQQQSNNNNSNNPAGGAAGGGGGIASGLGNLGGGGGGGQSNNPTMALNMFQQGAAPGTGGGDQPQQQQQQPQQQQQNNQQQLLQPNQQQQQPQQQQPQELQQQQAPFNISEELKKLQQMHNIGGAAPGPTHSLLGMPSQQQDPSTLMLQTMLDAQNRAGGGGTTGAAGSTNAAANAANLGQLAQAGMVGAAPVNPMLQPAFFQDARLLMAQNQLANIQGMAGFPAGLMAQQGQPQLQPQVPGIDNLPLPSPHALFHRDGSRRMRGGVIEPFPEKLHRLLVEVESAGRADVISFVANGRAFAIHKPDKFFKDIVPLYFRQSRLSSFKRQLNLYGFELINTGPARGGYYHELFVKDSPELCRRMRRVAVKVPSKDKKQQDGTSKPAAGAAATGAATGAATTESAATHSTNDKETTTSIPPTGDDAKPQAKAST